MFVILPQAARRLIPPLVSLLVAVILNTTLVQVIGGTELLESAEQSVERLNAPPPIGLFEIHAFEIYGAVAVVFFVICFPLTRLAAYLERRLAVRAPLTVEPRTLPVRTARGEILRSTADDVAKLPPPGGSSTRRSAEGPCSTSPVSSAGSSSTRATSR